MKSSSRAARSRSSPDVEGATDAAFREALSKNRVPPEERERLRNQLREQVVARQQIVPPGYLRRWIIDLGLRKNFLRDEPLFLRIKFFAAQTNATGTYFGQWQIGPPALSG